MHANYLLRLWQPIKQGNGFVEDITALATDWRRTIRLQGGYWQGSFAIEADLLTLQKWFYGRLGYHVQELAGGQTSWEGLIYELELQHGGVIRRRSLDKMTNAIRAKYTRWEGNVQLADWQSATSAINRYGRKEDLLSLEMMNQAQADAQITTTLTRNAWPWPRPVSATPADTAKTQLTVTVCGYAFCANWCYAVEGWQPGGAWWDGTQFITLSDAIAALYGTNLTEFLTFGWVRANTLQTQKIIETPTRVWDLFSGWVALGGPAGELWRLYVGAGRRLYYEPVALTPSLYLRQGGIYNTSGGDVSVNPYRVQPGVLRDVSYPVANTEPGSALTDTRDLLIDEVEADAEGKLSLRTAEFSEADLLRAQAEAARQQRDWLAQYWSAAYDADLLKRQAEWDRVYTRVNPVNPQGPRYVVPGAPPRP